MIIGLVVGWEVPVHLDCRKKKHIETGMNGTLCDSWDVVAAVEMKELISSQKIEKTQKIWRTGEDEKH